MTSPQRTPQSTALDLFDDTGNFQCMGTETFICFVGPEEVKFVLHERLFEHVPKFKSLFAQNTIQHVFPSIAPGLFTAVVAFAYQGQLPSPKPTNLDTEVAKQDTFLLTILMTAEDWGWADLFNEALLKYQKQLQDYNKDMSPFTIDMIKNHNNHLHIPKCKELAGHFSIYLDIKGTAETHEFSPRHTLYVIYKMEGTQEKGGSAAVIQPVDINNPFFGTSSLFPVRSVPAAEDGASEQASGVKQAKRKATDRETEPEISNTSKKVKIEDGEIEEDIEEDIEDDSSDSSGYVEISTSAPPAPFLGGHPTAQGSMSQAPAAFGPDETLTPCRFWLRGNCWNGAKCRWPHYK